MSDYEDRMKLSFCTISFRHRPMKLEDIIFIIGELGYDSVEIWGEHIKGYETSCLKLHNLAKHKGLEVSMISPYFDFTSSSKEWNRSVINADKYIKIADALNCSYIRCFTGNVPSDLATEEQWDSCVRGIRKITQKIRGKGLDIKLAIENHINTLADTPEAIERLLEEVDDENVGLALDFYNMWEINKMSPLELLDRFYSSTVHIHAKNAVLSEGNICSFRYVMDEDRELPAIRTLDAGDLDYEEIFAELQRRNYSNHVSIECFETERSPLLIAEEERDYFYDLV